jgi:hypothetical protein
VLCVDETSQVQALARSSPVLPMRPGMPETRTHDYVGHGVTGLFAASTSPTTVIFSIHRRHDAIEFKKLLNKIDTEVPDDLNVHLVCRRSPARPAPTALRRAQPRRRLLPPPRPPRPRRALRATTTGTRQSLGWPRHQVRIINDQTWGHSMSAVNGASPPWLPQRASQGRVTFSPQEVPRACQDRGIPPGTAATCITALGAARATPRAPQQPSRRGALPARPGVMSRQSSQR